MMKKELTVAAVQMTSSDQLADNLTAVEYWVNQAVSEGAKLVVLPENFALMAKHSGQLLSITETLGEGAIQSFLSELSKKTACWIVAGSLPISSPVQDKVYATCLVYNAKGERQAYYHKMHLFDVDIADGKKRYRESETFLAGDSPVVVNTPFGKMGLSICYDLRFPVWARNVENYDLLLYVANWPKPRVSAWDALLKARAIENMSYCIGVNRVGLDANSYEYSGHSAAYDVLGEKLTNIEPNKEETAVVTLTKSNIETYRNKLKFLNDKDAFTLK